MNSTANVGISTTQPIYYEDIKRKGHSWFDCIGFVTIMAPFMGFEKPVI